MKILIVIFLLFLLTHSLYQHAPAIRNLRAKDLLNLPPGLWLINFFDPKQDFSPYKEQFKKAAFTLEGIVRAGAVDAVKETTDVDPSSCPLVRLYLNGKVVNYNQAITAANLVNFLK